MGECLLDYFTRNGMSNLINKINPRWCACFLQKFLKSFYEVSAKDFKLDNFNRVYNFILFCCIKCKCQLFDNIVSNDK